MHKKGSHWFLPTESPANTIPPFLLLSRSSLALNLRRNERDLYEEISCGATNCLHVHLELYKPCSDYFLVELINSKIKFILCFFLYFLN
jgi:hypothetical protein